jgi:hypothetical protein
MDATLLGHVYPVSQGKHRRLTAGSEPIISGSESKPATSWPRLASDGSDQAQVPGADAGPARHLGPRRIDLLLDPPVGARDPHARWDGVLLHEPGKEDPELSAPASPQILEDSCSYAFPREPPGVRLTVPRREFRPPWTVLDDANDGGSRSGIIA